MRTRAECAALPVEGEPRLQQWQIKGAAIERHPAGARGEVLNEGGEHRRLFSGIAQEILAEAKLFILPDAHPNQKNQRSSAAHQSGRLRVEENERAQINFG